MFSYIFYRYIVDLNCKKNMIKIYFITKNVMKFIMFPKLSSFYLDTSETILLNNNRVLLIKKCNVSKFNMYVNKSVSDLV